jgi:hypothetical protein
MLCEGIDSIHSYKLMRRLGKGGCVHVVMAQRRSTGQTVAVKTIHARCRARCPDIGELLKEACFLAACHGHPCLVGFHGSCETQAREYCLFMDYVGPSLDDALARHVEEYNDHAFPEADVRGVKRQLLTGATAMHERGIIHRDIKPTNILKTFSFLFSRRWAKRYGGLSDLVGGQRTKAYFRWTKTYFATATDHIPNKRRKVYVVGSSNTFLDQFILTSNNYLLELPPASNNNVSFRRATRSRSIAWLRRTSHGIKSITRSKSIMTPILLR